MYCFCGDEGEWVKQQALSFVVDEGQCSGYAQPLGSNIYDSTISICKLIKAWSM
jgi:hypothetical protein